MSLDAVRSKLREANPRHYGDNGWTGQDTRTPLIEAVQYLTDHVASLENALEKKLGFTRGEEDGTPGVVSVREAFRDLYSMCQKVIVSSQGTLTDHAATLEQLKALMESYHGRVMKDTA